MQKIGSESGLLFSIIQIVYTVKKCPRPFHTVKPVPTEEGAKIGEWKSEERSPLSLAPSIEGRPTKGHPASGIELCADINAAHLFFGREGEI